MDEDAKSGIAPQQLPPEAAAIVAREASDDDRTVQPSATASASSPPTVASRQSLVVPPRGTRPIAAIVGTVVCASAGFALVWWTGFGRSAESTAVAIPSVTLVDTAKKIDPVSPDHDHGDDKDAGADRSVAPRHVDEAALVTAAPFPPQPFRNSTDRPKASAFSSRVSAGDGSSRSSEATPGAFDDAAVSPAAFETSDPTSAEETPQGDPQAELGEPSSNESASTDSAAELPSFRSFDHESPHARTTSGTVATGAVEGVESALRDELASDPSAPPQAAAPAPFSASSKSESVRPAAPTPQQSPVFDDPEAPVPVALPGNPSTPPTSPSGAGLSSPMAGTPRGPERLASVDGSRGFGMAPAIAQPPAASDGEDDSDASSSPPTDATPVTLGVGAGRPGPLQLEGVQTPQVALEKRGPREVQVGKVARYETIVRNVGAAIAREVTLHDLVPAGTRLVSTVPPASPDDRGGLVWQLGDLAQGGEKRVAMELMPTAEGEVGSVASVSFRADASVRSLATRPDVRIEVQAPKPVLVGAVVDMSIVLSNPGTGEATGIVLEGLLPDALAHSAGREVEFDVGRLRPGESRRIDLRLASKLPGTHPLRLTVRADGGVEAEETVRVAITAPTLELTADMPGRRYLQRPATCVLSMANGGTAPARNVELAAQLPQGMKFVRANNAGTYDESTHRVIWHLEELPPGEVGSVELVIMPVALGPQRIAVAARALDGLSDQSVETIEVEGVAALAFQVSDSEDPVEVGGVTEYVVRLGNQGTKPASGVRVSVSLLGDLEPIEASGPVRYRVENLSIVFDPIASLAPDEELVFRVRARGRRAGDQRVQVQVTSTDTGTPVTKEEVTRVYADD